MEKLKPCPFCGDTPTEELELIEHETSRYFKVVYLVHHCFSGLEVVTSSRILTCDEDRESALERIAEEWNRRAADKGGEDE